MSSVAAGGIASFHTSSLAVRLKDDGRLCGSIILLIQNSTPLFFIGGEPDVAMRSLRSVPSHSAVWTFLSAIIYF